MKIIAAALLALTLLAACANTKAGLQQDADRWGDKTQQIGEILTTP